MAENEHDARGHLAGASDPAEQGLSNAGPTSSAGLGRGGITRTTLCECLVAECESALGTDCVALVGELDISGAQPLRDLVGGCLGPAVVLDLSRLSFVGAAGVAALTALRADLETTGRELVLAGAQPPMRRLFSLLLLDDELE